MQSPNNSHQKYGLKEIRINMGLFDFNIVCVIGNHENCEKYIQWKFENKEFTLDSWDNGHVRRGCVFSKPGYVPVLWIPRKPKTPREHATLAHEALHCVYHLFEWAAIPMSRDTEEVVTHSMAHIINEILSTNT